MKQAFLPVLVLVVVVGLAIITTWPSSSLEADHYQRFHDGKSLYSIMSSRIRSGDSLQNVEKLLGPAIVVTEAAGEIRNEYREQALARPESFPHGVYEEDAFVTYPIGDDKVTLQLRNGFVVNHQPGQYEEYHPTRDIAGYQANVGGSQ